MERGAADNFQFNTESEFVPILGLVESKLNSPAGEAKASRKATSIQENHHPELLSLLSSELSVAPEFIHDFELYVSIHFMRYAADSWSGTCTTHNRLSSVVSTMSSSSAPAWITNFLRK